MSKKVIAIHGGAGTILRSQMTPELEQEYHNGLNNALAAGWNILNNGGTSLDAVEAAVIELENFPLFNAGRGSVFTSEGKNEMDASIMDGSSLNAGSVAFIKNIKNPVKLARAVMERTDHVLLAGDGANQFASQHEIETETDEYFFTEHRWLQLQDAIASGRIQLDHNATGPLIMPPNAKPIGTVGAVACDINGNLAAATSTGGMTNKKFGRIGDSPVIGAGNYADETCAVSCTGHGEFFMLGLSAYDVSARMKYKEIDLRTAAAETIDNLSKIGGEGGLIAVDTKGNVTLPFNSEGMYRGWIDESGVSNIAIYS